MASTSPILPRSYVDFEPRAEWLKSNETDTIMIDVAGFRKDQLKVLISTAGVLKISGERPIEGNHWSRFICNFNISRDCNVREIQAKFDADEGLLFVILPKSVPRTSPAPPLQAQDSAAQGVSAAPDGEKEVTKAQQKKTGEEEKGGISGELAAAGYGRGRTEQNGRRETGAVTSAFNKRRLLILSVILGVMVSLGLAIYLSYRLKGL
ncbi:22.0 kDa heat shock protein [Apostasia shenzhenica]|uniref:22.0 kDa heat shock protein n=1 Tax=Apostasia shenzhenica TaxID=1088818 RepID=A0A2I0A5T8_9ASPA|nr:22.0 kDa heat shock protein [Apostasia shenzhenica]